MAFNSSPFFLYLLPMIALLCFPLFSSPVFSISIHDHSPDPPRGLLFEDKTRLGSTPPSCYNKCNQCHPCTAVQVPSLSTVHRVQPPAGAAISESDSFYGDNSRYSNYKPLGWKCRCKDHFYNP
uniref:Epidermal patterning factor-like protein n=1 Tax=Opuntia streptacantha TaxID=393608 RepID=A0A7C9DCQ8_OPUST